MTHSTVSRRAARSPVRTILVGALAIGTIDIAWAMTMSAIDGRAPITVLHTIAGGLLGREAMQGGLTTAFLGLLFHYFIAFCVMTTYYLASRRFPQLAEKPWIYGPIYGIIVFVIMYQVVLPLSAWHTKGIKWGVGLAKGVFIHMFGVGLVAALIAKRGSSPR